MTNSRIIYTYSRKQAIADGEQILLNNYFPNICSHFYKYPVYMTRIIWEKIIQLAEKNIQSIDVSIYDILFMSVTNLSHLKINQSRVEFKLYLPFTKDKQELENLIAECGPKDIDDPSPCIIIMTNSDL